MIGVQVTVDEGFDELRRRAWILGYGQLPRLSNAVSYAQRSKRIEPSIRTMKLPAAVKFSSGKFHLLSELGGL